MKNFRTTFNIPSFPFNLSHQDSILSIGSCFAENIGEKLHASKFQILQNPFGILYNPMSVGQSLKRILLDEKFTEEDIFQHNDLWHSRLHHTRFSQPDKSSFLTKINTDLSTANSFLKKTNCLLITLGTAFVWEEKATNEIVANCHKRPQKLFNRRRLSIETIKTNLIAVLKRLKSHNPDLQIIMTVSPVRHTNDGFIENQRSKAALILAIAEMCQAENFIHYFPAYELVQDDLRDYRFYKLDMLHPNETAVEYVWQHFKTAFFVEETNVLLQQIEQIKNAAGHRPFHVKSEAHQAFLRKNLKKIEVLKTTHEYLNFVEERALFLRDLD